MRISQDSADTLAFFTRRSWLVMLVGLAMGLMAVVLALVPAKGATFSCSRVNGYPTCEVREERPWGSFRITRVPVAWMKGAEAEPIAIGSGHYYRLNLLIDDGYRKPYYFAWYGNQATAERDAAAVTAFVEDPAIGAIEIRNDKRGPYLLIAAVLAFSSLVFVFWGSYRTQATFSRELRRVRVTRTGLLGTHERHFAMGDIHSLDVAGLAGDCQLYLRLHSGVRVDLSSSTDTEGLVGPRRVRARRLEDADRLRAFCGLAPPGA